jgi:hypothetical protein
VDVAELWLERWRPSSGTMRHYGAVIDTAAAQTSWVATLSPYQRQRVRENLADFSEWLADQIGGRHWRRKKVRSLAVSLALTAGGVALLITAPVSWPAILLAGAGGANLVYDVTDAAFQHSIQNRVAYLRARIDELERATGRG